MAQTGIDRLRTLTAQLNQYRYEYYSLNAPTVSDEAYDRLFDELGQLEQELGIQMGNSPTQTVGWPLVDKLNKISHPTPCCRWIRPSGWRTCVLLWATSLLCLCPSWMASP